VHAATVQRACRTIETAELEPNLAELAAEAGMSPSHFQRVFKSHVGLSPKGFAKALRAKRFKTALKGNTHVTGALYEAGFSGPSRAYDSAKESMGMSPTSWRDGAKGETIRYAVANCYLGRVIVAGTARGICAIEFDDQDEPLLEGLRSRFPNATLAPADDSFTAWLRTVLTFVESPQQGLDLPLDIRGTAFQERVWRALRQIAAGTTVSYAELAKKIGQPTATRAVARACAANKIAVAIPCHRVVRTDGTISGYRWGPRRKRMILDRESQADGADT
jgi:AraC family transcriptional regulator of adaptative response/methylated-DNA-[protein]-cysteine methyltransferase